MGGIAGIIDFDSDMTDKTGVINEMLIKLKHRGPDRAGLHAAKSSCMGCMRLNVFDAAGGAQPMTRSIGDHTYTLVFDGEIFNANGLREELIQKGYSFFSHSDTEALLLSYIEWGPSCLDKLSGMFAFAVWEEHKQRLFMARDRMGVKPLFYCIKKNALLFASEIKALLCTGELEPIMNENGILELFALFPARTPGKTLFCGIEELRPSECMIFSRLGVYIHRYWQYECTPHLKNAAETAENLRCLLIEAVKSQLSSTAPLCTFLSGGLDSSIISSIASGELLHKAEHLSTYSIHFYEDEQYFREGLFEPDTDSGYIKTMAEFLKCEHARYTVKIEDMTNALEDAVCARDMPGMADIDSSMLLLCREMANNFRVAVSGECADEIFGGYPWFYSNAFLYAEVFPWADSLALRKSIMHDGIKHLPIEEYAHERYMDSANETPLLSGETKEAKLRRRMFYINVKWFMTNLLERQDRMGMASGLEIRSPFCDHRLMEFAWNIPWDIMNHGGMEKGILRLAAKNMLPQPILDRKKCPYPKTHHPEYLKKATAILKDIMEDKTSPVLQLIDARQVKALSEHPESITSPWYGQLMTAPQLFAFLIQADIWMRKYRVGIK